MPKDTYKKIALVTISLAGGGAERSTALLSQLLSDRGFDVTIITLNDHIAYPYSGKIYNMGLTKKDTDTFVSRLFRFKKLRRFLKAEQFDIIIDNRNRSNARRERFYLTYVYKNQQVVYVTRSSKLDNYFPKKGKIARKMVKQAAGVVGVSQRITEKINERFKTSKAQTIYNPISSPLVMKAESTVPYFIFVGRLINKVKNIELLLSAFAKANIENTVLHIYGDGPDKDALLKFSKTHGLSDKVNFYPFQSNIEAHIAGARALLLTSHYEGFPRVLIEALAVGTPVISVDCDSGPNEIIKNEYNGLLVPNHDQPALAAAIERFDRDEELYKQCKSNAKESVEHLSFEHVGAQWERYLQNL